jgi:hypothetical protein
MNVVPHSVQHQNANDAIEALERKVGVDASDDPDSIDSRLRAVEASSGHTHVCGETPTGAIDGSNATFTLAQAPSPAASLLLFLSGLLQSPGGNDFTLSGATITFVDPPASGSALLAHYIV